jgi:hypothetical protein
LALAAAVGLAGGAAIAARTHSSASKPRNNAALLAGRGPITLPLVTIIGEAPVGDVAPLTLPVVTIIAEPPHDMAPRDGSRIATTAALVTPATLPASTTALATSPASLSR